MTDSLEARISRLEALEAIRNLKARYCQHCDQDYNADALASLFTEDAIWDAGAVRGIHKGRDAIREFFSKVPAVIPYAAHLVTNPLIDVDDGCDSARGNWRMLMPFSLNAPAGVVAAFQVAEYDEEYLRMNGGWFFSRLKVRLHRLVLPAGEWTDMSGG